MGKSFQKIGLNVLVLACIIAAILVFVDLRSVGRAMVSMPLEIVAVALLLATLDRVFMGYKWYHLLQAAGAKIGLRHTISAYYQSGIGSRLIPIPLGAELLRANLVISQGVPGAVVFGSMAIEKVLAFLGSSILALMGCIYLFGAFEESMRRLFVLSILIGMAGGIFILIVFLGRSMHRFGGNLISRFLPKKLHSPLSRLSHAMLTYRDHPKVMACNLLLVFIEQILQFTKFFIIGRALDITLPLVTFFAIISLTILLRRITGYIESWGLGELSAVVILALMGIDRDAAVTLILLNYAITFSASLPGAYLLFRSGGGLKRQIVNKNNIT